MMRTGELYLKKYKEIEIQNLRNLCPFLLFIVFEINRHFQAVFNFYSDSYQFFAFMTHTGSISHRCNRFKSTNWYYLDLCFRI